MNRVGVGVVKVKLEAALLLPLQKTIILPHQFPYVTAFVLRPGGVEGSQDGTARQAYSYFVVREGVLGNGHVTLS